MCGKLVPSLNDYRGQELVGFYVFAITLAYLAVAMRFISQKISGATYRLDDYLVIVALVRHVPRLQTCSDPLVLAAEFYQPAVSLIR